MKSSVFFFSLALLISLCSCSASNWFEQNSSKNENSLELTISLDKSIYHLGEPVVADITLTNIGKGTLLINSRMSYHWPSMTSPIRELSFNVTTPAGSSYAPSVSIQPKFFSLKDFIYLEPNDSYELTFYFASNGYEFLQIGEYRIAANYQNFVDPNYINASDTRIAWKGELNSNEVLLTIVP
jgi:hypothetical protein